MKTLSPSERRALRARAHALSPVVMISGAGLSDTVSAEIERALKSHELIKIRVFGDDRGQREVLLEDICRRTGADPVQHIGKVLVIHRKNPEPEPAPRPERRERPAVRSAGRSAGRTAGRPAGRTAGRSSARPPAGRPTKPAQRAKRDR